MVLHAGAFAAFAPDSFAAQIGKPVLVTLPSGLAVTGNLCKAVVSEDGSEAEVTVEVPDRTLPPPPLKDYSIAQPSSSSSGGENGV